MKILGIIPARGGSKGIPRKNLKKINGKSLLQYAIEAGQNSKYINRLIVSTEDEEIKNKSKELGCEVIERPGWLAKDETPTLEVIENILTLLNKINKYIPDYIVLIQPTAPLRESKHIDEGIDQLLTSEVDSVISVSEVPGHYNPNWLLQIENNVLSTIKGKDLGGLPNRRQN